MKWTDERGYQRAALVRDEDPDTAARTGIPVGPPDLESLDWDGIKRDLHNALFDRGLATWEDVLAQQDGVLGAIRSAMHSRMKKLYRD